MEKLPRKKNPKKVVSKENSMPIEETIPNSIVSEENQRLEIKLEELYSKREKDVYNEGVFDGEDESEEINKPGRIKRKR